MFLISGTFEGNFLRAGSRIKLPADLSFFDFRNYQGAIPRSPEINLIIQKIQFRSSALTTSHLMLSLCVPARDRVGRDGFFSCRMISPELPKIDLRDWFSECVGILYRYLRNEAPLANGSITHLPEPSSSKVFDFSGLKSRVDAKRTARLCVDWRTELGFGFVQGLLNERLLGLESFTIICGTDGLFQDDINEILYDWYEEDKLRQLERKRRADERRRYQLALKNKLAAEEEFWDDLFQLAELSCIVLLAILSFFYLCVSVFKGFPLNASDPLYIFSVIAGVVALIRTVVKFYESFGGRL